MASLMEILLLGVRDEEELDDAVGQLQELPVPLTALPLTPAEKAILAGAEHGLRYLWAALREEGVLAVDDPDFRTLILDVVQNPTFLPRFKERVSASFTPLPSERA